MAKNIFHDIIPKEKRSIRNIALPNSSKKPSEESSKIDTYTIRHNHNEVRKEENETIDTNTKKTHKPKIVPIQERDDSPIYVGHKNIAPKGRIWFLAICAVLVLGGAVAFFITKAEADITVKKFDIDLNNNVTASKSGEGQLLYSTISLTEEGFTEITATEQKEVSTTASGKIVMYNDQATSQKLIATTRLETPGGLIFRLDNTITIPARKIVSGKSVPGSIDASIHADKPGNKYNVGFNDFNVVAFKDDPRYNVIYGRSKTSIGGGNLGKVAILSQDEAAAAKKQIEDDLVKRILTSANAQVPENFILLPDGYEISFSDLPQETIGEKVKVKEKATFKGYIFDKAKLAAYLGKLKNYSIESASPISINTENMKISSVEESGSTLKFHMDGKVHIAYTLDIETLKKDLKGKSKAEALKVLEGYPAIEKAKIVTFPLWKVPDNSAKITVNLH